MILSRKLRKHEDKVEESKHEAMDPLITVMLRVSSACQFFPLMRDQPLRLGWKGSLEKSKTIVIIYMFEIKEVSEEKSDLRRAS